MCWVMTERERERDASMSMVDGSLDEADKRGVDEVMRNTWISWC